MRMEWAGRPADVREIGKGPAVILVHGYPLDGAMWSGVARALSTHFRASEVPSVDARCPRRSPWIHWVAHDHPRKSSSGPSPVAGSGVLPWKTMPASLRAAQPSSTGTLVRRASGPHTRSWMRSRARPESRPRPFVDIEAFPQGSHECAGSFSFEER